MDALLVMVGLSPLIQPSVERFRCAFVFAFFTIMHEVCFAQFDGLFYYGSAAVFDLMVILVLASMAFSEMGLWLQIISLASIVGNGAGWAMWEVYAPPTVYNSYFLAVYSSAVLVMVTGGTDALHRVATSCRDAALRLFGGAGADRDSTAHGKEATRWTP